MMGLVNNCKNCDMPLIPNKDFCNDECRNLHSSSAKITDKELDRIVNVWTQQNLLKTAQYICGSPSKQAEIMWPFREKIIHRDEILSLLGQNDIQYTIWLGGKLIIAESEYYIDICSDSNRWHCRSGKKGRGINKLIKYIKG